MGRTARDNRDRARPRPVEKIQLSGENLTRRLIAAAVALVIGGIALTYAVSQMLAPEVGWQTIEASLAEGPNCGSELVFHYELGAAEGSPSAENSAVTTLYTDACRKLYQLFHTEESFTGVTNLWYVSQHPNETVTVDDILYRAFESVQRCGDRTVYLGPVYAHYGGLFYCTDDSQLVEYDPFLNNEIRAEFAVAAAFARDPQAIELRLLGGNRVCLSVSEEYLAYAQQEGIERFLDFGWLKNAFIVDAIAEIMVENGYTYGSISSGNGFSRNLDDREVPYSQNLFDRVDGVIYPVGEMTYRGPMSIVYLRDYPMNDMDRYWSYQLEDGSVRSSYLDPADGLCRSAAHDLVCYSQTLSCAEIALQAAPIYVSDTLDVQALEALAGVGIQSIRCEGRNVLGTEPDLEIANLYEGGGVRYSLLTD